MGFSNKLFEVVLRNDDYVPVYTPVLINLPNFKKLYMADKSSDKDEYAKQLAYIYFIADPKSPYFESTNKEVESMLAAFGKQVKISKQLQTCIDEYVSRNTTIEIRSLESSLAACDNLLESISDNKKNMKQFDNLIRELEREIDQSSDLQERITLMNTKMELEDKAAERAKKSVDLIPKINKMVDSIMELRKTVRAKMLELESDSNKENIDNFLITELINSIEW